jgi:gamma-glutamylcyclotransferase
VGQLYFAYGSKMLRAAMTKLGPQVTVRGVARLSGHRLAFTRQSRHWAGGAADVVAARGLSVYGVLYEIGPEVRAGLDRAEGVPTAYQHKTVRVHCRGEYLPEVLTYEVRDKAAAEIRPSDEYLSQLLAGAREHGLPAGYLAFLAYVGQQLTAGTRDAGLLVTPTRDRSASAGEPLLRLHPADATGLSSGRFGVLEFAGRRALAKTEVIAGPHPQAPDGVALEAPVFEGPVFEGPVFEGPVFEGTVSDRAVFEGTGPEGTVGQDPPLEVAPGTCQADQALREALGMGGEFCFGHRVRVAAATGQVPGWNPVQPRALVLPVHAASRHDTEKNYCVLHPDQLRVLGLAEGEFVRLFAAPPGPRGPAPAAPALVRSCSLRVFAGAAGTVTRFGEQVSYPVRGELALDADGRRALGLPPEGWVAAPVLVRPALWRALASRSLFYGITVLLGIGAFFELIQALAPPWASWLDAVVSLVVSVLVTTGVSVLDLRGRLRY